MRICVYAISKNEEKFVERFCEAATDADLILVADTGSTDMTVPMLGDIRERKGIPIVVHQITIKPWRFDLARNAAMALIPANFDVCVSLDLDEHVTDLDAVAGVLMPRGDGAFFHRVRQTGHLDFNHGFDQPSSGVDRRPRVSGI